MNKKALVIEDDKNIAELLRLYLEKDGFEVSIAPDGGKGLQLAEDEHPDVVLLDIMRLLMDGGRSAARYAARPRSRSSC